MYKKVLYILLVTVCLFYVFCVNAETYPDTINSVDLKESEEIVDGLKYEHYVINSKYKNNSAADRQVYTYTIKQNSNLKLATWTYKSQNGYSNHNLMEIAKNYEENHPGWIVLGGINTEGYVASKDKNSVYELTNSFTQDGDLIRKDVSNEETKELIALFSDGTHSIKRVPEISSNPYFYSYHDEYKNINEHLEIKFLNTLPSGNELSLLTPALSNSLDLSEYNVYEFNYEMYRVTSNFPGGCLTGNNYGVFLKGQFKGVSNLANINEVKLTTFYIVTKASLNINTNDYVKVQFDYLDEFKNAESIVGYWFKYMENGVVCDENYQVYLNEEKTYSSKYGSHDYWKSIYKERAGIGFKDNGEIVILASNTLTGGPTQYEVGNYFKMLGCTDAYQFDGGGSVTFIKRDDFGNINMLNQPGDGVARSILSGLFIVMKVPETSLHAEAINANESLIKLNINEIDKESYDSLELLIDSNDIVKLDINFECKINGLQRGIYHTYELFYVKNGVKSKSYVSGKFIINYISPNIDKLNIEYINGKINININITDVDSALKKLYIKCDTLSFTKVENNIYSFDLDKKLNLLNTLIRFDYNDGEKSNTILVESKDIEIVVNSSVIYLESFSSLINSFFEEIR